MLVRLRYETDRNEMATKWNAFTTSILINQLDIFLFSAQLMGGGEIEEIAQSAEILTSCLERSLTYVPIF